MDTVWVLYRLLLEADEMVGIYASEKDAQIVKDDLVNNCHWREDSLEICPCKVQKF